MILIQVILMVESGKTITQAALMTESVRAIIIIITVQLVSQAPQHIIEILKVTAMAIDMV